MRRWAKVPVPKLLTLCLLVSLPLRSAKDDAARSDFFESKIRPLLVSNCYSTTLLLRAASVTSSPTAH